MATTKTLNTEKLTPTVGAEVLDVDVDRLRNDPDLPEALMEALEANGILVFRGLHIDDETQLEFCRKLGPLQKYPGHKNEELFVVSLEPEVSPHAKYLKGTFYWHIDDTMQSVPSKATMLSAKVLPPEGAGGDTEYVNTYAAYDDLSDEEKERFASLRVFHSQVPIQSLIYENPTEEQLEDWRARSREHPLVWTKQNGRKSLVLGLTMDYVIGMDPEESKALIEDLNERGTRPERVYRHVWAEGDTVMWDNRGVMHRVHPYDPSTHREMHRCTLVGDEPIQ
jgi:alpha-ketoglutarate-dependent taurine dioxygenase